MLRALNFNISTADPDMFFSLDLAIFEI